jgi:hypothetical protein
MTSFMSASEAEAARQASFCWQSSPVPQLISLKTFCDATETSEAAARQWLAEGKLRGVSANGHNIRIPVEEIARIFKPVPAKVSERPKAKTPKAQGARNES